MESSRTWFELAGTQRGDVPHQTRRATDGEEASTVSASVTDADDGNVDRR